MSKRPSPKGISKGISKDPIAFYGLLLVMGLVGTLLVQLAVTALLPQINAELLSQPLNGLIALAYGWILAGLAVCALLYAWLRLRAAGVVLSLIGLVAWVLGLRLHLTDPSPSALLYLLPLLGGFAVFREGLRYASRHLLPVVDEDQAAEAFKFLRGYAHGANRPGRIVAADGEARTVAKRSKRDASKDEEKNKNKFAFVLTGCDHVVAVSDKLRLQDIKGPGLVFMDSDDRLGQQLDLRPQVRPFSLECRTKDGIEVRIRGSVSFKIDGRQHEPRLGAPLPFKKAAAFTAAQVQRVEHHSSDPASRSVKERRWHSLPGPTVEHILRDIISRRSFDDLYAPDRLDGRPPRRVIVSTLSHELTTDLRTLGIQLIAVDLGNLEPSNSDVYVQRARNWQTEWARRIALKEAEGQAERLQILERARADTRSDLILDLGRQLEALAESRDDVGPEAILDELLAVIEASAKRPRSQPALPPETQER